MILYPEEWSKKEYETDVLIIGSGIAGTSVAIELQKKNIKTIVVEGGKESYTEESQNCYEGSSSGINLPYGLKGSRLRFHGGSSNCWAGMCGELEEEDFQDRDWVSNSGWPIKKKDLVPFYKRASDFLAINRNSIDNPNFIHGMKKFNGLETRSLVQTKIHFFKNEFKSNFEKNNNLHLFIGANFYKFWQSDSLQRVNSIGVRSFNLDQTKIHAKYFILACGGIENPRILLHSSQGKGVSLGNLYGNVGRYFCDHPIAPCATVINHNGMADSFSYDENTNKYNDGNSEIIPYYRIPFSIQKKFKLLNVAVKFQSQSPEVPISSFKAWKLKNILSGKSAYDFNSKDVFDILSDPISVLKSINSRKNINSSQRIALRFQIEQKPEKTNAITLTDAKDKIGLNRVNFNWAFSDIERRTVDVATAYIASLLHTSKSGSLLLDSALVDNKSDLPFDLRGGQHHSGTTRMSESPKNGVVDVNLKVHGSKNLFIVGSSVFPTNGWVNPSFTIAALGIRLADHIEKNLLRNLI
jgi:choline dehydrogenase-like flavoprotein